MQVLGYQGLEMDILYASKGSPEDCGCVQGKSSVALYAH